MKADVMYEMHKLTLGEWACKPLTKDDEAWFLCLHVKSESGSTVSFERVALFNLDSQAEVFMEHMIVDGHVVVNQRFHERWNAANTTQARKKRDT